jgi:hypothetical protein
MLRKLILATAATAALATAVLAPTAASAHYWHGHYWGHHWYGGGFYGPVAYAAGPECYVVRRVVATPVGPRSRLVTVCD